MSELRPDCPALAAGTRCVRQTEDIYERWGAPSLMVAKFVPGFAAVATSMAGLMRTRLLSFALFDTIGALLWSGVAVTLGWFFRDAVNDVIDVFNRAGLWGLVALATALPLTTRGAERFRISLGQIFYHKERRVTLDGSVLRVLTKNGPTT